MIVNFFPRLRRALTACALLCFCCAGCGPSVDEPDDALLQQRVTALISLGWGWLHAENVELVRRVRDGDNWDVAFSYDVVIDVEGKDLPKEQKERFASFLPMCRDIALNKGARCPVSERVLFTHTEAYGWMPVAVVEFVPSMQQNIASWKPDADAGQ